MNRLLICLLGVGAWAQGTPPAELPETHLRNIRQLTTVGSNAEADWSPDGRALVFASNHHNQEGRGRMFDLFRIDLDGTGLERITTQGVFNAFPHFSPNGKQLLWVSGRVMNGPRQFNVFVMDWVK